ncbi:helix-turn-helix domain-containing protein [Deinococcus sp.]|uniref:helix-turn-helix domain-containing protein n=1 Tax=Deinococcus sp. TaxID=47478 RepID=UPI003B5A6A5E
MTSTRYEPRALLTIAEAAQLLHLSDDTVRRQIKEGDLPAIRLGTTPTGRARYRIARDEITRRLEGPAITPAPAASERLQAAFAELSDEQQNDLIAQAVRWARRDQPAPSSAGRAPEPSREEGKRRFAHLRLLQPESSSD